MVTDVPKPSAWELVPLGRAGWRICERSRGMTDARRLVAYVEKNEIGMLDVLWLRSPCPSRSRYRDLDELLAELNRAVTGGEERRASSPPHAIPHLPPTVMQSPERR